MIRGRRDAVRRCVDVGDPARRRPAVSNCGSCRALGAHRARPPRLTGAKRCRAPRHLVDRKSSGCALVTSVAGNPGRGATAPDQLHHRQRQPPV